MDHENRNIPAGALARNKALTWVCAITLGAGAASTLGAVAVATNMHSAAATTASSATTNSGTITGTTTGSSGSQLRSGTAPTTANSPPVATSGAS
jgi:hypothetical protein